tara:strand:+ start:382 stop:582 length:201 start_codon:yes stop_codon:yes gene_type:complete
MMKSTANESNTYNKTRDRRDEAALFNRLVNEGVTYDHIRDLFHRDRSYRLGSHGAGDDLSRLAAAA